MNQIRFPIRYRTISGTAKGSNSPDESEEEGGYEQDGY